MVVLSTTSFVYFLINFQMKKVQGSIVVNTISNQVSEVSADILSGFYYVYAGPIRGFQSMFMLSIIGTVLLLIYWDNVDLIPVFVLIAKFGVSANFNMVYIASVALIPPLFASSVWGINNTVARLCSMLAPEIAELAYPTPLIISLIFNTIAIFVAQILVQKLPKF